MIVNNESLKDIKSIGLFLENCDDFTIDVKDIIDIFFDTKIDKKNHGKTDDGFIIISKKAFKNLSSFAANVFIDGTTALEQDGPRPYYLKNRIKDICDVCEVDINFIDHKKIEIDVPYNPLEENMHGNEIEWSNCPSVEINEDGNMVLLFGKKSKSATRIDNNYNKLIKNFNKITKKKINILKVKIQEITNLYGKNQLSFLMDILNKEIKKSTVQIVFENYTDVNFHCYTALINGKDEILMSKMQDGKIFVAVGFYLNFRCDKIKLK